MLGEHLLLGDPKEDELMGGRDHVDLPDDFVERATEITDVHAANPVKADLAGTY